MEGSRGRTNSRGVPTRVNVGEKREDAKIEASFASDLLNSGVENAEAVVEKRADVKVWQRRGRTLGLQAHTSRA